MAVEATRQDLPAAKLRRKAARRMLAMALVLDGHSREVAAEADSALVPRHTSYDPLAGRSGAAATG